MKKSKIGIALTSTYLVLTTYVYVLAYTCEEMYCGVMVIVPVIPWHSLIMDLLEYSKKIEYAVFIFSFFVILNSAIIYGIGWSISWLIKKAKTTPK